MSRWPHGENPCRESIGAKFDPDNKRHLYGRITLSNERGSYANTTKIIDTITKILDKRRFDFISGSSLDGISEKGKVSLISRHRGGARFDSTMMSCTVKSHSAVFDNDYLRRIDLVIGQIQLRCDDLHTVSDHHKGRAQFEMIADPNRHVIAATEKWKPDYVTSICSINQSRMTCDIDYSNYRSVVFSSKRCDLSMGHLTSLNADGIWRHRKISASSMNIHSVRSLRPTMQNCQLRWDSINGENRSESRRNRSRPTASFAEYTVQTLFGPCRRCPLSA